ncbi:MAG: ribosome-associated translation inhibitor RaiA [Armatimonadota bacterium]|nr:MAG: ribosome-associated translation inhibitor RaiA [Armatimonadota bacterium]
MRITFTGKQIEVTDALKRYAERKLGKFEKQSRRATSAHVVQSTERNWHNVEITLNADGGAFRGQGRSDNMYGSIDIAVAKLETQIKHRKGKIIDRAHGRTPDARAPEVEPEPAAEPEADDEPRAHEIRRKRVALTPMSVDEAIDEMELLAHQFLMFANADTGQVNVVYRRDEGDYGLIEPDF